MRRGERGRGEGGGEIKVGVRGGWGGRVAGDERGEMRRGKWEGGGQ